MTATRNWAAIGALALIAFVQPAKAEIQEAIFAGGCFWCIEKDFEHVAGVKDVVSGYSGGTNDDPTYKNHTQFRHREVVKITFNTDVIDYSELLSIFWRSVDPTDGGGQFCDRGHSYTTAVYGLNDEQLQIAEAQRKELDEAGVLPAKITTEIAQAAKFTLAEEYHQDFYKKNPLRYNFYRYQCGRDQRVKAVWGAEAYKGVEHPTN